MQTKGKRKSVLLTFAAIHFHPKCVSRLMIFFLSIRVLLFNSLHFLCRHQRFEKAFLLAVDLEARDLFMVSVSRFLECVTWFVKKVAIIQKSLMGSF